MKVSAAYINTSRIDYFYYVVIDGKLYRFSCSPAREISQSDLLPIDSPLPLDLQIKYFHLEPASELIWKEFRLCGYGIEEADDL